MSTRASAPSKRPYRMVARADAAAATRHRIAAAAWAQFSARPYDDVRLADVASDAGVSVQTVHSVFGHKDELFVAAWRWMTRTDRRSTAPVGDLKCAVRLLYDSYESGGDAVLRLLAQEDRIPAVRKMTDDGRSYQRDWVARTFAPLLADLPAAARRRRHAALIVATDLYTWKLLRRDMRLPRGTAERIVMEMIAATKGAP
jgi:AcrR family transcriptional regulator